ncbi:MAG: elongation factor P [bacterium]
MLSHTDLKKGVIMLVDGQPYEVLEAMPQRYAQRKLMIQTKIRNLITGNVLDKTVHQGESFEEAEINKLKVKFLYSHRDKFFFCEEQNPAKRFELLPEQVGQAVKYIKPNTILDSLVFNEKIIRVVLPIKVQLRVAEAPPGAKGDRAQSGTKFVTLETGAKINAPLFVEQGDIIEINTETNEYSRRIE